MNTIRFPDGPAPGRAMLWLVLLSASAFSQKTANASLSQAADLIRRQKPAEAEVLLRNLLKSEPGNAGAWNLLGAALDSLQQCQPAEAAFQRATQLAPAAAGVWNNLGNHYLACGDPRKASETFRKVLSLEPAHPNANLQLARLAVDQRDGAEALKRLEKLDRAELVQPAIMLLRARALCLVDRKADALEITARLEKQANGPAALKTLGTALEECGEFARAEALFSRALEADPTNPEILLNVGLAALRAKNAQKAREVLDAGSRLDVKDPTWWGELGRSAVALGQSEIAVEFLKRALALKPSSLTRLDLATALSKTSGPARALEELDKVPDEDRRGDYYLSRAELLDSSGKVAEAGASLSIAMAREPARLELYRLATLFYLDHSQDRQAAGVLDSAAKAGLEDRDLQLLNAVVAARLSRFEESRQLLERISGRWPDWSRPYLIRGIVELNLYHNDEALKSVETAMKMGESGSEAYFYLAFALHSAEPQQWKRALEAAQKAIQLGPDDPWARILAGRIAKQAAQYDVALAFLTEATRMAPELAQAHFWLGSTYLAMGKAAEGQREMEEVDHLHVQNPARFDTEDWGLSRRLFALSR